MSRSCAPVFNGLESLFVTETEVSLWAALLHDGADNTAVPVVSVSLMVYFCTAS